MHRSLFMAAASLIVIGCSAAGSASSERATSAEAFFRGVFACDPAAIDQYAAADVSVSYPIFETLYQASAIRGREAVKDFSAGFCNRWEDPRITIYEAVEQDDRVVLVWDYSAVPTPASPDGGDVPAPRTSWGGISFFRFDPAGRVVEEVGEESTPGPAARMWGR